jgi:hypothetical protein
MAVATIHESFTGIFRPPSRSSMRSSAHAWATAGSIGTASNASASISVASRKSRVRTSGAARTPGLRQPTRASSRVVGIVRGRVLELARESAASAWWAVRGRTNPAFDIHRVRSDNGARTATGRPSTVMTTCSPASTRRRSARVSFRSSREATSPMRPQDLDVAAIEALRPDRLRRGAERSMPATTDGPRGEHGEACSPGAPGE